MGSSVLIRTGTKEATVIYTFAPERCPLASTTISATLVLITPLALWCRTLWPPTGTLVFSVITTVNISSQSLWMLLPALTPAMVMVNVLMVVALATMVSLDRIVLVLWTAFAQRIIFLILLDRASGITTSSLPPLCTLRSVLL